MLDHQMHWAAIFGSPEFLGNDCSKLAQLIKLYVIYCETKANHTMGVEIVLDLK